jgi:hypothetical protein
MSKVTLLGMKNRIVPPESTTMIGICFGQRKTFCGQDVLMNEAWRGVVGLRARVCPLWVLRLRRKRWTFPSLLVNATPAAFLFLFFLFKEALPNM